MNDPEPQSTPEDVVPRTGVTADALRLLDTAHHHPIRVTFPGDVLTDPDGLPIGVEPSTSVTATATVRISRTELNSTGLTDKEITRARITE